MRFLDENAENIPLSMCPKMLCLNNSILFLYVYSVNKYVEIFHVDFLKKLVKKSA